MSFSDLTFLFYFLPLFFAVYYILPFRFKNAALVLGSFAFYFIGAGARDTLLLSGVLLLHYALARAMAGKEVRTRKALLIIALAADLFCLVYFKYAAFILENLGKLTGTAFSLVELALPLGVSFYLFQSAGYLIDVYRGEEAEKNLIDYAAFTIAFPQLTMGPILRYREWRGALKEPRSRARTYSPALSSLLSACASKCCSPTSSRRCGHRSSASVTNICRRRSHGSAR